MTAETSVEVSLKAPFTGIIYGEFKCNNPVTILQHSIVASIYLGTNYFICVICFGTLMYQVRCLWFVCTPGQRSIWSTLKNTAYDLSVHRVSGQSDLLWRSATTIILPREIVMCLCLLVFKEVLHRLTRLVFTF